MAGPRSGWRPPAPVSPARICPPSSNASIEATRRGMDRPAHRGWASPSPSRSSRSTRAASRPRASPARGRRLPPGCRWRLTLRLEPDDRRDFDGNAERQLARPQRLPGVPATLAERLVDQVRSAVEDLRLFLEACSQADETANLAELFDLLERPGMLADQCHDVKGTDFGGARGVLQAYLAPHHAPELDLAIPARYDPRGV